MFKKLIKPVRSNVIFAVVSLIVALISVLGWRLAHHSSSRAKADLHVTRSVPEFYDISIRLDARAYNDLRNAPRKDVNGQVMIKGFGEVSGKLHIKGRGSFQNIDKKPSFTCKPAQPFAATTGPLTGRKFHLHNSAQDPSFISDFLARKIYRRFSIPAGQIAFAHVTLNKRSLGLYTVTEGIGRTFLSLHYGQDSGRLIEGEHGEDVSDLLWNETPVINARSLSDSLSCHKALLKPDDLRRIIAAECLCANRDGYVFGKNNYWIYQPKADEWWRIFPHTADGAFSFEQTAPMMVPIASLATDLLTDESQRRMVLGLLAEQTAPGKVSSLIEESSLGAFAFVQAVAARIPDEAEDRCKAVLHLLRRLTNNVADIRTALRMEQGELDFTETFKDPHEWRTKVGDPDGKTRYDLDGSTLTVERAKKIPRAMLECPILLRPGHYKLTAWIYCERAGSETSTMPEASIELRNIGSVTNAVYGRWSAVETILSIPDRFYGRLFHLEATSMVLNVNNFSGRISLDLARTGLERIRD